jgi:hypothetical protein
MTGLQDQSMRVAQAATMTPRKPTAKTHNKKLRRRREGLSSKSYEYGELEGVELALFIRYPKRGEFYAYLSKEQLPWLKDVENMVRQKRGRSAGQEMLKLGQISHPKTKLEFPADVKPRVDKSRRKPVSTVRVPRAAGDQHGDASSMPDYTFPELPKFDFSFLKERAKSNRG